MKVLSKNTHIHSLHQNHMLQVIQQLPSLILNRWTFASFYQTVQNSGLMNNDYVICKICFVYCLCRCFCVSERAARTTMPTSSTTITLPWRSSLASCLLHTYLNAWRLAASTTQVPTAICTFSTGLVVHCANLNRWIFRSSKACDRCRSRNDLRSSSSHGVKDGKQLRNINKINYQCECQVFKSVTINTSVHSSCSSCQLQYSCPNIQNISQSTISNIFRKGCEKNMTITL